MRHSVKLMWPSQVTKTFAETYCALDIGSSQNTQLRNAGEIKNNKLNNYPSNHAASKHYGGAQNGFKSDSRGKNLCEQHIKGSNSIINSGSNPSRAGGKFNSHNSQKFNGPVRNGGGQGKFSSNYGNSYYGNKRPTSQPNNFSQDKSLQIRHNFGGMERNARGKYNSAVVKNAMNALGHTPNKHA